MTSGQKTADFTQLAAMFAKNYGPLQWKHDQLHFDLLNIDEWLKRAAETEDDLAFYELCATYIGSLHDAHSGFYLPSDFRAELPFRADLYDGKVVVDGLSTLLDGQENYPIAIGDELLAIDGVDVQQLIDKFAAYAATGNSVSTRRLATAYLTVRPQQLMPHAVDVGDTSQVTVKHAGGSVETVTLDWMKSGDTLRIIGPVISPSATNNRERSEKLQRRAAVFDYLAPLQKLRNMRLPAHRFVQGFGSTKPVFYFPPGFDRRMGLGADDFFYTGTYASDGVRIGYIRIPSFQDPYYLPVFRDEIAFMEENTDVLVLDIMRNPGGDGCFAQDLLTYVIPSHFRTVGLEIRATRSWVLDFESALQQAEFSNASSDVIQQYRNLLKTAEAAYMTPSGRTPALPVCGPSLDVDPATTADGKLMAYTKPVVLLTDEFSASAADLFAAVFQDAKRGPVVGMRTMGAGGNVEDFPSVTTYSDGEATITESLMVRKAPIQTKRYGATAYIENVGVRPDMDLNYMTLDNLNNGGYPFVEAFTRIAVEQVRKSGLSDPAAKPTAARGVVEK